ncbi:MAG: hypothetical protein AAGJ50_04585 [Pseudomonadota bacterium]
MDFEQNQRVGPVPPPSQGPLAAVGSGMRTLVRQAFALLGLLCLLLAVPIGFLTPFLPIGLPIGVIGAILLGRNTIWGRNLISRILERHPQFEKRAPNWLIQLILSRDKHSQG